MKRNNANVYDHRIIIYGKPIGVQTDHTDANKFIMIDEKKQHQYECDKAINETTEYLEGDRERARELKKRQHKSIVQQLNCAQALTI